jgi:hypothetical protein
MAQHTSGGTCSLWVNGRRAAEGVNASISIQNQLIRCDVLGRLVSTEILLDGSSCMFSANQLYVFAEDWSTFGIMLQPGADGQVTVASIPTPATAFIYNERTGLVIARATGLMAENITFSVSKGVAATSNLTMQGTLAVSGANA